VIFDPLDYASYYDLSGDETVYQGQVAPQDAESVPYATPTSDPDVVISPYEPHAAISVAGIPYGAKVQDPVSNLVFLNPSGWSINLRRRCLRACLRMHGVSWWDE
jgi:hypothetical protein